MSVACKDSREMVASMKRIISRGHSSNWFKTVALILFFWWLIIYGFDQKSSSDFGELLDRNKIEELQIKMKMTNKKTNLVKKAFNEQYSLEDDSESKDKFVEFWRPPNIFNDDKLGEQGVAVTMPSRLPPDIQKLYDDGWEKNSFNQYLSDLISVHRTLPDFRSDYCRDILLEYRKHLPTTSVIIIFFNEAWSTLLRSVHSVLDRSPEHLIEEVILVDDFSDMGLYKPELTKQFTYHKYFSDHLKQPLDDYMSKYPKVKILRAEKREGLIRARIRGAIVAKAKTLTFLDSHIECTEGWLEPLLDRIALDSTNVACPIISRIDDKTFEFSPHMHHRQPMVGGFDWSLTFKWHKVPSSERERKKELSEPTRSPTMAGGLFAIDKAFFEKLGMYDPGKLIEKKVIDLLASCNFRF